jgi:hypothetical protein
MYTLYCQHRSDVDICYINIEYIHIMHTHSTVVHNKKYKYKYTVIW